MTRVRDTRSRSGSWKSDCIPSASLAADPAAGSDATREDLRRLGATVWFALTGDDLAATPGGCRP